MGGDLRLRRIRRRTVMGDDRGRGHHHRRGILYFPARARTGARRGGGQSAGVRACNKHRRRPGLERGPIATDGSVLQKTGAAVDPSTNIGGYGSPLSRGRPLVVTEPVVTENSPLVPRRIVPVLQRRPDAAR